MRFIRDRKEFVGKQALLARDGVPARRLSLLSVDTADVDPEGNETVWCSGKVRRAAWFLSNGIVKQNSD